MADKTVIISVEDLELTVYRVTEVKISEELDSDIEAIRHRADVSMYQNKKEIKNK